MGIIAAIGCIGLFIYTLYMPRAWAEEDISGGSTAERGNEEDGVKDGKKEGKTEGETKGENSKIPGAETDESGASLLVDPGEGNEGNEGNVAKGSRRSGGSGGSVPDASLHRRLQRTIGQFKDGQFSLLQVIGFVSFFAVGAFTLVVPANLANNGTSTSSTAPLSGTPVPFSPALNLASADMAVFLLGCVLLLIESNESVACSGYG